MQFSRYTVLSPRCHVYSPTAPTRYLIKLQGLRFIVSFEHTGLSFLEPPGPLLRDVIGAQCVD